MMKIFIKKLKKINYTDQKYLINKKFKIIFIK